MNTRSGRSSSSLMSKALFSIKVALIVIASLFVAVYLLFYYTSVERIVTFYFGFFMLILEVVLVCMINSRYFLLIFSLFSLMMLAHIANSIVFETIVLILAGNPGTTTITRSYNISHFGPYGFFLNGRDLIIVSSKLGDKITCDSRVKFLEEVDSETPQIWTILNGAQKCSEIFGNVAIEAETQ